MPVILSTPFTACSDAYSQEVLADSPVGYWKLGETAGPTAVDSSGNGTDATYTLISGTQTFSQPAIVNNTCDTCVAFTGSSSYVRVPDGILGGVSTTGSIEFWIRPPWSTGSSGNRRFWGGGNLAVNVLRSEIFSNTYYWGWTSGSDYRIIFPVAGAPMTAGNIYHWVFTWNDITNNSFLYQNGSQVGSNNSLVTNSSGENNFRFNSADVGGNAGGDWDELAIYTTDLSPTRVLAHYNAGI